MTSLAHLRKELTANGLPSDTGVLALLGQHLAPAQTEARRLVADAESLLQDAIVKGIGQIKEAAAALPYRCQGEVYSLAEHLSDCGWSSNDVSPEAFEYRIWLSSPDGEQHLGVEWDSFPGATGIEMSQAEALDIMNRTIASINAGVNPARYGLPLPSFLR